MASGSASQRRVEPSISVNKNVTVPDGGRTPTRADRMHASTETLGRKRVLERTGIDMHKSRLVSVRLVNLAVEETHHVTESADASECALGRARRTRDGDA